VADGIYQVRGFDTSNMTMVEGDHGVIVIDPMVSRETAAAAIALPSAPGRPGCVKAVIYTPTSTTSAGILGVVSADTDVPIVAGALPRERGRSTAAQTRADGNSPDMKEKE
jgi:alkyl sulfatase BDS1-like metallo-beta-lactamase superfamily hydrolase